MYKPKAKEKIRLTTTLALLRENNACESGYKKLRKHLGLKWPDDKPINLLVILKNNGVQDMLWCIRATVEPYAVHWKFLCNMYADFAESVLPIWNKYSPDDDRPLKAIQTARSGNSTDAANTADAADAAAYAADAADAAYAANAAYAADAAKAADATANAANAAADAAADAKLAEQKKQSIIIRRYLK
jgi:hypothetical protein